MRVLVALGLISAVAAPANGQASVGPTTTSYETRAQLEQQAARAEKEKRSGEAWLLRSRLERGDFQDGDRIVVTLAMSGRRDTMQVQAGRVLRFAGMGELSLDGVLRSELNDALRQHLSKYLRNPDVYGNPLLPLSVHGSVGMPGFYYTAADVQLRDVIMRAGGLRDADLNKVVIRRAGETIWNEKDVRVAMTEGLSLDRLHLRAGDEIYVPQRKQFQLATILSVVSATTAILVVLLGN